MELNEQVTEDDAFKIYEVLLTVHNYQPYKPTSNGLKVIASKEDWMNWRKLASKLDCRDVILLPAEHPSNSDFS